MPELPDVEVLRRRFAKGALERPIRAVDVKRPRILAGVSTRGLAKHLVGRRFQDVRRYGKRLYCAVDRDGWISIHFGLTGDLVFYRDDEPKPHFARVILDFPKGEHVAYTNRRMIGRIEWVDDMAADVRNKKLEPDVLDPKFSPAAFKFVLQGRRDTLKSALMDQMAMAGIGNAYSDEVLFQCRLHPLTRVVSLADSALVLLYHVLRTTMKRAIAAGADPDRLPKEFLIPHRRAGEMCPRCGGALSRLEIDGRGSYFCTRCQPKPKARRNGT